MNPFPFQRADPVTGKVRDVKVTPDFIRHSLGKFEDTPDLLRCPAKYAARIAQNFTATDPSVVLNNGQWHEVEDLWTTPRGSQSRECFTDGVGTISKALSEMIWRKLGHDPGMDKIIPSAVSEYPLLIIY
jgi:RNA dependent RNA polymerase